METSGTIATDWEGKEVWMSDRKKNVHLQIRRNLKLFALDSVKLSTVHRKERRRSVLCRDYLSHIIFLKILFCNGFCNVTSIIFAKSISCNGTL